eukprot:TRINITY_DN203_c2_g2_i1.p1 TRINITY_DN203_c2_g2~~TRINITY_DN203_c2_g2_i1.p1  ORF type:complete len:1305 (-),score=425.58 TRINITY_DN203_c2_g2_i1:1303-5217(-)
MMEGREGRSGKPLLKDFERSHYIEELRNSVDRLKEQGECHERESVSSLALLVGGFQLFMWKRWGSHAPKPRSIPRIPFTLFRDFRPNGGCDIILRSLIRARDTYNIRKFDFQASRHDDILEEIAKDIMAQLMEAKLFPEFRVAFGDTVSSKEAKELSKIVKTYHGVVVEETEHPHFVVFSDPPHLQESEMDADDVYLRVLASDGGERLVHWWYFPDSYDSWEPQTTTDAEPQDDDIPSFLTGKISNVRVHARFLRDTDKYNEWMNPNDYVLEDNDFEEPEEKEGETEEHDVNVADDVESEAKKNKKNKKRGRSRATAKVSSHRSRHASTPEESKNTEDGEEGDEGDVGIKSEQNEEDMDVEEAPKSSRKRRKKTDGFEAGGKERAHRRREDTEKEDGNDDDDDDDDDDDEEEEEEEIEYEDEDDEVVYLDDESVADVESKGGDIEDPSKPTSTPTPVPVSSSSSSPPLPPPARTESVRKRGKKPSSKDSMDEPRASMSPTFDSPEKGGAGTEPAASPKKGKGKGKEKEKKQARPLRIKDLRNEVFMIVRKLYHVYFIILAMIFLLVLGLNFLMQTLFSLFLPQVGEGRSFFFVISGLVCLILLLSYFVGMLVWFNVMLLWDAIATDEFIHYRRMLSFDMVVSGRLAKDRNMRYYVDKLVQYFIILTFDVVPIGLGITFMYVGEGGLGNGAGMFFLSAMVIAFGHVTLFWFVSWIKDNIDKTRDLSRICKDPNIVQEIADYFDGIDKDPTSDDEGGDPERSRSKDEVIDIRKKIEGNVFAKKFANKMTKRKSDEDELNVCVDLGELYNRVFGHPFVRVMVFLLLIGVFVGGILIGSTPMIAFSALLLFAGFIIVVVGAVNRRIKPDSEDDGLLNKAMSRFFRQHCGIKRVPVIRFATVFFIIALIPLVIFIVIEMWVGAAVTGIALVFVELVGFVAYFHPQKLWLVTFIVASIFSLFAVINNFIVFGLLVGIVTVILVVATHALLSRKMPHSGAVQYLVMFVFLCLAGLLFLIGFYTFESSSSGLSGNVTFPTHPDPYSYCQYRWENISLVEYAFFSKMAYSEGSDFTDDLNAWFPSGWEIKHSPDDDDDGSDGESATFYDLYHTATQLSVVAVRGTAGTRDIIQDIDIWLSVSLFQAASYVGPAFLQPATIDIIYWSNFMKRILKSPDSRFYFDALEEYVDGIKATRKSVVLTGHSLGGGLAKIVGAKESLVSVTFSSPGLMYTSKTVDIDYHSVHDYGITLKPDKDIIPKVDTQSGTVLPMDCDQGIATCHKIHVTICELLRSCGDPNGRGLKVDTCPKSFDV